MSSAANRLVDEGLRVIEHPGVSFRDGPTGRRAGLDGGPDVWEVVRALKSARAANSGVPLRLIRIALRYWASYSDEIDTEIGAATAAEDAAEQAWQREQQLL